MGQNEFRVIDLLRKSSRSSLTAMSLKTGLPITTLFKMVKKLERHGVVIKHVTLMDFAMLRYPLRLGIFLKATDKDRLKSFLEKNLNLNTLQRTSGNFDFYAELYFKDMAEYQQFIDTTEDSELTKGTDSHYFLTDIKEETFKFGGKDENRKSSP